MDQLDSQSKSFLETADLIMSLLLAFRESAQNIMSWGTRFGKDTSKFVSIFEQTAREPKGAPIAYIRDCLEDKALFDRVVRALRQEGFIDVEDFDIVRRANPYAYITNSRLEAAASGEYKHAILWPRYTVAESSKAVCHLLVKTPEGEFGATAFFTCEKYLITAFHCIKDAESMSLEPYEEIKVPNLNDWKIDAEADLAVTTISDQVTKTIQLASNDPWILDDIVTFGFPRISRRQPTLVAIRGNVISGPLRDYSRNLTGTIAISTVSAGGHSGGPVLGRQGKVVAMIIERREEEHITERRREFSIFYEAVPVSRIWSLIRAKI